MKFMLVRYPLVDLLDQVSILNGNTFRIKIWRSKLNLFSLFPFMLTSREQFIS